MTQCRSADYVHPSGHLSFPLEAPQSLPKAPVYPSLQGMFPSLKLLPGDLVLPTRDPDRTLAYESADETIPYSTSMTMERTK